MTYYSYNLTAGAVSETVNLNHFGANFRNMFPNIGDAFDLLSVTHLRCPSGSAQEEDITNLIDGQLNQKLTEFLEWTVERGTTFTLSIPVGDKLATQSEMTDFVRAIYAKLGPDGHLLKTIEVSNEYWGFQEAWEYGRDAALATEYLANAYSTYNAEVRSIGSHLPKYLRMRSSCNQSLWRLICCAKIDLRSLVGKACCGLRLADCARSIADERKLQERALHSP
ncbi:hypothetical protein [Ruegeria sp. SCP11]|uniref:hypothetical protein n=1 Tax=Ruegeria sp. SCP11 TaxID=3141378 RepID=UPI003336B9B0